MFGVGLVHVFCYAVGGFISVVVCCMLMIVVLCKKKIAAKCAYERIKESDEQFDAV